MKLSSLLIIFCISPFILHSGLAEATFRDAETAEGLLMEYRVEASRPLSNQFQDGFYHRKLIRQSMQTSVGDDTKSNNDADDHRVQRKVLHEVHSGPNPIGNSFPRQKMKRPRPR